MSAYVRASRVPRLRIEQSLSFWWAIVSTSSWAIWASIYFHTPCTEGKSTRGNYPQWSCLKKAPTRQLLNTPFSPLWSGVPQGPRAAQASQRSGSSQSGACKKHLQGVSREMPKCTDVSTRRMMFFRRSLKTRQLRTSSTKSSNRREEGEAEKECAQETTCGARTQHQEQHSFTQGAFGKESANGRRSNSPKEKGISGRSRVFLLE